MKVEVGREEGNGRRRMERKKERKFEGGRKNN
jgi:hypothetical protein